MVTTDPHPSPHLLIEALPIRSGIDKRAPLNITRARSKFTIAVLQHPATFMEFCGKRRPPLAPANGLRILPRRANMFSFSPLPASGIRDMVMNLSGQWDLRRAAVILCRL